MKANVEVIDATDCVLIKRHELARLVKLITELEKKCEHLQAMSEVIENSISSLASEITHVHNGTQP